MLLFDFHKTASITLGASAFWIYITNTTTASVSGAINVNVDYSYTITHCCCDGIANVPVEIKNIKVGAPTFELANLSIGTPTSGWEAGIDTSGPGFAPIIDPELK